ncbi:PAS/PAC sensor hybrid histidine kinase [Burkholderia sp. D7]|nr:PAS/PAC sensor hybrid histidine kinase [Burkholderia sp. D7]
MQSGLRAPQCDQAIVYRKSSGILGETMNAGEPGKTCDLSDGQRFELLVTGIRDYAIYMLNPAGFISSWNAGAERFKGYAAHEIIGRHFSVFYTEEDRSAGKPTRALQIACEQGKFEDEGWRVRRDGTRFWASVVIDPIRDPSGELIGFAKITRDISERKQAAEALERANAALFQSQKMEAIGQLTGGIAHDFNNLLAVISSSLDLLATRAQNYADTKVLDAMRRAVERGALLTQQLLSFARQQPLMVDKHDLNTVISGFESILRRAGNSTIEMDIRLACGGTTVLLDAARFEAALLNLVVNARDAMPDGGKLVVALENVELGADQVGNLAPGSYVRVFVSDTGTGMPPRVVARAFEPFFTTKEVGKGTGLGLSQVYGFIAQSGGDVMIHSKEGKGTTISMYLPVVEGEPDDGIVAADACADTVLIVEDEPEVLESAGQLFRNIGYEVVTATSGVDAMAILKRRTDINILFTDVVMPKGINGIQLARAARDLRTGLKVIVASGYPLQMIREQHGRIDDLTVVKKPYRLAELAKALSAAV